MSNNQELNKKQDIDEFKKTFYLKHGIKLYIYTPLDVNKKIPLNIFHDSALNALHESHPRFSRIKNLQNRIRFRDYIVYVQVMSYLAHKEGHSKTSIGRFLKRNHATVINSCKMIENGFFSNEKLVMDAHNNTLKHLEKYVGTIPKDNEEKDDTQPMSDPIWDQARSFIAKD